MSDHRTVARQRAECGTVDEREDRRDGNSCFPVMDVLHHRVGLLVLEVKVFTFARGTYSVLNVGTEGETMRLNEVMRREWRGGEGWERQECWRSWNEDDEREREGKTE